MTTTVVHSRRACYAMSGTDIIVAYELPMRCPARYWVTTARPSTWLGSYAMLLGHPSTEIVVLQKNDATRNKYSAIRSCLHVLDPATASANGYNLTAVPLPPSLPSSLPPSLPPSPSFARSLSPSFSLSQSLSLFLPIVLPLFLPLSLPPPPFPHPSLTAFLPLSFPLPPSLPLPPLLQQPLQTHPL
eukprot:155406-Rhodomonas_salina.6